MQAVKQQSEQAVDTQRSARHKSAQQRAAQQRAERIEQALAELAKIEQQRAEQNGGHKPKGEPRASTTDADARKMKMGDGGFRPAFNAQLATDTESRVIVGVRLTENGTDYAQAAPMVDQIEKRMGIKPEELLVDGGFTSKEAVDDVSEKQVILYGPVPERKATPDPFAIKPTDSAAVKDRWTPVAFPAVAPRRQTNEFPSRSVRSVRFVPVAWLSKWPSDAGRHNLTMPSGPSPRGTHQQTAPPNALTPARNPSGALRGTTPVLPKAQTSSWSTIGWRVCPLAGSA